MATVRGDVRSDERARARTALMVRAGVVGAWLAVGVLAFFGDLVHTALRPDDDAAQATVIVAMWLGYALVLAALVLPGPRALTVARIGVPAGTLELALAAAEASDPAAVVGNLACVVGTLVAFHPVYAEAQVDAASYGDERRFLLRPPGPVIVALVVPMGAVAVAGMAAGPLLLAGRGWPAGIVAAAFGLPAAAFAAHTLCRLARRWLVFVPNGLVLHDHLAVAEPLPLSRRGIDSIGPARAGSAAVDLTAQAFGMALELRLSQPVKAGVMTGRIRSEERSLAAMLVSPSRPAAVLATAERRGLELG
jgi:hypothetical protein